MEDMSMCVHEDRLSVVNDDKINELDVFAAKNNEGSSSQSTADQDPVNKIFEKSKKLTEKHAKYTKAYRKQQAAYNEINFNKDMNLLSNQDWRDVTQQKR